MRYKLLICFSLLSHLVFSQKTLQPPPAGLAAIQLTDLKNDLYAHAGVAYKGRGAGTINELNGAVWVAEQYRKIGLLPAGEFNTYYQYFNMWRNRPAASSKILLNGQTLLLWQDVAVAQMAHVQLDQPIVYLGPAAGAEVKNADVKGKIVALDAVPGILNKGMSLPHWRYQRFFMAQYGNALLAKGAVALLLIGDEDTEKAWADAVENFKQGSFDIEGGPNAQVPTAAPVLWVRPAFKKAITATGARLSANLLVEHFTYPSVNVVGLIKGTDPVLAKEHVLYSGHTDAHGIRNSIGGDSIFYGADDNASVNVAMLAVARAFKKNPPKRSVLFVVHGAEERGLLGSRWYAGHPTVYINSIVTVLNGDMIGRNHPDSAAVLGLQAPHLTSPDLAKMVLEANAEGPQFKLDTLWDKVEHPEYWFFRSDHVPYARLGIPSLMYTTLLHPDYHTPKDNADNIDYTKLKKMTEWMYRTGWKAANATQRPNRVAQVKFER